MNFYVYRVNQNSLEIYEAQKASQLTLQLRGTICDGKLFDYDYAKPFVELDNRKYQESIKLKFYKSKEIVVGGFVRPFYAGYKIYQVLEHDGEILVLKRFGETNYGHFIFMPHMKAFETLSSKYIPVIPRWRLK